MSLASETEPQISKPPKSLFWRQCQWLIRCVLFVGALYLLVEWFVTANCINHLVVICDGPGDPVRLVEATLVHPSPSACWSQPINLNFGRGSEEVSSLRVLRIEHAWFDGTLILSDENGSEWMSLDLRPPGRCGRTLVIRIDSNGDVKTLWNALPK